MFCCQYLQPCIIQSYQIIEVRWLPVCLIESLYRQHFLYVFRSLYALTHFLNDKKQSFATKFRISKIFPFSYLTISLGLKSRLSWKGEKNTTFFSKTLNFAELVWIIFSLWYHYFCYRGFCESKKHKINSFPRKPRSVIPITRLNQKVLLVFSFFYSETHHSPETQGWIFQKNSQLKVFCLRCFIRFQISSVRILIIPKCKEVTRLLTYFDNRIHFSPLLLIWTLSSGYQSTMVFLRRTIALRNQFVPPLDSWESEKGRNSINFYRSPC